MTHFTRRGFLATATASLIATTQSGHAQSAPFKLRTTSRTLDIDGRAATVWGIEGPSGQGLFLDPGQRFRVDLTNDMPEPTLLHWHGQIPPNEQDGVPDLPLPKLRTGETRSYDFAPMAGTFWMHAHIPLQEMNLLAAPLIVRDTKSVADDRQEAVMFLHDFSFKSPQEVMRDIAGTHAVMGHGGMDHSAMPIPDDGEPKSTPEVDGDVALPLNDYDWDAYLANDRTLNDPDIVRIERNGRVRLRIINAASATVFWIDTGGIDATLVAVDGHDVNPVRGTRFGIAMGQRLDLEIDFSGAGAWPVLALREGGVERGGMVFATNGAAIPKIPVIGTSIAPAFDADMAQEIGLSAPVPLASRVVGSRATLMLSGTSDPYEWTINGAVWGRHRPVTARTGERVEISFHNMSIMAHPMHLHGHVFQVVEVNGKRINGALRDTVHVPPFAMVTVALDAGEAARWMLHCHHMPHLETGMMTEFSVHA